MNKIFAVTLIFWSTGTVVFGQGELTLWYDEPADNWNAALPIGNGRLGAMVFGDPAREHLQLNEETVWAGEPGNNLPSRFAEVLPEVRRLIFEEKYKEAETLLMTKVPRHAADGNNYGMPYQALGDLFIDFPAHEKVKNYRRTLDISKAVSTVSYEVDGVTFTREIFSSFVDQAIIIKLSASKPNSITCRLSLTSPHKTQQVTASGGRLHLSGKSGSVDNKQGKVEFSALVQPKLDGGKVVSEDSLLDIKNANEAIIYISMATNFESYNDLSGNAFEKVESDLKKAASKSYSEVKSDHIAYYKKYFDRVSLELEAGDAISKRPTDERLNAFSQDKDLSLVSLYFQFGRYLLISSSQPNTQPANLQGIWNDKLSPPWDSKYTVNINTEMNYWPAEVTNLPELHEPLFSMLKDLAVTGKQSAEEMYSARGWNMHHNTDIWRITGPIDGAFYGMWPMGGAWLTQHIWQHYLYTGDVDFLEGMYSVLEGAAMFYADILQEEPGDNWLVVTPSMSPENRHSGGTSLAAGTTMDNQLVFDVFSNFLKSSEILEKSNEFIDSVKTKLDRLPPMQSGKFGQLQEWMQDWDRPDDKHRHVSHLYGLYPSNQISPFAHPKLFNAARTSLVHRGDKSTGWSMGWKVNLWARLLDGDRAFKLIADQLSPAQEGEEAKSGGTYPNLLDAHPPFQIDGNFGCTSGIAEMLMQSHDGNIFILPAVPNEWAKGEVKGLAARGGFIIEELSWDTGKVKHVKIKSTLGGNCRIRSFEPLQLRNGRLKLASATDNSNPFYQQAGIKEPLINAGDEIELVDIPTTYLYDFNTEKGKSYTLKLAK